MSYNKQKKIIYKDIIIMSLEELSNITKKNQETKEIFMIKNYYLFWLLMRDIFCGKHYYVYQHKYVDN